MSRGMRHIGVIGFDGVNGVDITRPLEVSPTLAWAQRRARSTSTDISRPPRSWASRCTPRIRGASPAAGLSFSFQRPAAPRPPPHRIRSVEVFYPGRHPRGSSRIARVTVPAQSGRKAALTFIFVTVLIDMLAFGMIIPVLPVLVQDFVGGNAARAAEVYGLFGTAWALMQFIFSPVQGSLSDHFGRRTRDPHLLRGLGSGFHSHGAGAESLVAAGRQSDLRYHRGELQHRRRLYFGCNAAGEARRELRHDRRRIRCRIRVGTGAGRLARRHFAAAAVLGVGLHGAGQCMLGTVRAARIIAQGKARAVLVAATPIRWEPSSCCALIPCSRASPAAISS